MSPRPQRHLRDLTVLGGIMWAIASCSNAPGTNPARDAAVDATGDISGSRTGGAPGGDRVDAGVDEAQAPGEDAAGANLDGSAQAHDLATADAPSVTAAADALPDGTPDAAQTSPSVDGAPPVTSADAPGGDAAAAASACTVCTSYGMPTTLGRVTVAALDNMSGMAISKRNPGVIYVHNDLTRTEFFALSETAALLTTISFSGAAVVDMEDMAVAHCPTGSCVYLADTGDNNSTRTSSAIVRMTEPDLGSGQAPATTTVVAEKLTFSFPDGPHNTESLLVDPGSDTIYVITKVNAVPSTVYRLPAQFGGAPVVAQKVVTLTVPKPADGPATGASAQPCGAGFLLRTNTALYEFRIPVGSPFEGAFAAVPVPVPLAVEAKGEAVTYRPDGRGYLTTGEGAMQPVSQVTCL